MSPIKPSQQIATLHVGTNPPDAYTQLVQILFQNGDILAQTQQKESFVEQDGTPHTVYTHVFTEPPVFFTWNYTSYDRMVQNLLERDQLSMVGGQNLFGIIDGTLTYVQEGEVHDGTPE